MTTPIGQSLGAIVFLISLVLWLQACVCIVIEMYKGNITLNVENWGLQVTSQLGDAIPCVEFWFKSLYVLLYGIVVLLVNLSLVKAGWHLELGSGLLYFVIVVFSMSSAYVITKAQSFDSLVTYGVKANAILLIFWSTVDVLLTDHMSSFILTFVVFAGSIIGYVANPDNP